MPISKEKALYYLIRTLTHPCTWLPYSWLHRIGKALGSTAFYFMREYRKRALSNLALANDLKLSHKELIYYAKKSFQNLAINCLEYPKLAKEKDFSRVIHCENPEVADLLYKQGQGIIFFCGHQSNWEVLFLDGTTRMKGVAIGKAIKNKRLYNWILSIREKNGGKIIAPRNAVFEGFRALRKGIFMGIVGDQGMPDSGYSFPFLGRRAWTSTAPALLAYKTNCPIIFAATRRVRGGYRIRYSDPIWPDLTQPAETEVIAMMNRVLTLLQESIQLSPGEWLWQHNRWKQQNTHNLYKRFRQDCICLILPDQGLEELLPHLPTLKLIYPLVFLFLLVPAKYRGQPLIEADEVIYYTDPKQMLRDDFRFKLIFNFTDNKDVDAHYEKLSAFEVLDIPKLKELAAQHSQPHHNLSDIFKRALCRPGSIWQKEEHAR
jgi:KDO2-lipid IV(A) lauroyltransferase